MTFLIVLAIAIYILFGYLIMNKIDIFLDKNNDSSELDYFNEILLDDEKQEKEILLFGDNNLTKSIGRYCIDKNISLNFSKYYNELDFNRKYSLLLAISDNDTDNLTVSTIGRDICSIPHIASLCNKDENLKMYKDFGIDRIITLDNDLSYNINVLKELVDDENKK